MNDAASKQPSLDAIFAALADPTRRAILTRLASGEATVSELVKPHRLSQPTISKHLSVLEAVGLVVATRDAQRRPRRLEPLVLARADRWLESFRELWEARYEALDHVLEEMDVEPQQVRQRPVRRRGTKRGKKK